LYIFSGVWVRQTKLGAPKLQEEKKAKFSIALQSDSRMREEGKCQIVFAKLLLPQQATPQEIHFLRNLGQMRK